MLTVAHNMAATNAYRQFNITTKNKTKTTEKLSSGYRINRAADDAAGLSISEKMRNQIRGLRQGCDNIDDGISLVKTADGALSEMSNILHRMNELSVKAYNDTYCMEDRQSIQDEINELLNELQRTTDNTEFNGIKILQGDKIVTRTYDNNYVGSFATTASRNIPSWLSCDDKMTYHSQYNSLSQKTDDTTYMVQQYESADGKISYCYYGPAALTEDEMMERGWEDFLPMPADTCYRGAWSSGLSDNVTVGVNFSALANITDADELYSKLEELMGTGISIPCASCDYNYAITFGGEVDGTEYKPSYFYGNHSDEQRKVNYVNVNDIPIEFDGEGKGKDCFTVLNEMIYGHLTNPPQTVQEEENYKNSVKQLGSKIAKKFAEVSYNALDHAIDDTGHFQKVLRNGDYGLVIYDYRDRSSGAETQADVVKTTMSKVTTLAADLTKEVSVTGPEPLWIQDGANAGERTPLHLANGYGVLAILNTDKKYNVANYEITQEYSQEFLNRLKAWNDNCDIVREAHTYTATWTTKIPGEITRNRIPASVDSNGEIIPARYETTIGEPTIEYHSEERVSYFLKKVNRNGDPEPQPGPDDVTYVYKYNPSSNTLIHDALKYLNENRSQLGAMQNRLEHTFNNNENYSENLMHSESVIRDTDMAVEVRNLSLQNILEQTAQAMLANANQNQQRVLSLLQ